MHDVVGDRHQCHMRRDILKKTDFILICIPKNDYTSLLNVDEWICEADSVASGKPIFLVLTKSDVAAEQVSLEDLRKVQ